MSSIFQFINNLIAEYIVAITLHILFHSETKITLFYLFLFALFCFHSLSLAVSLFVIRYHLLPFVVIHCHSMSLTVLLVVTCCHLLYHSLPLVVIRCTTLCQSLSLVVPLAVTCCHSMYRSSVFL